MGIYVFEMGGLRVAAAARSEGMPERFGCLLVESVCGRAAPDGGNVMPGNGGSDGLRAGRDESVGGAAADFLLDIVFEDVVEGGGFRARATGVNCFEFGMRGVFCEIDLDGGRGLLRVVRDESAVEYSMKLLFGAMLGMRGGGLMHAAALARDGKGRIFCGPPGAGKSTLAGIASGGSAARYAGTDVAGGIPPVAGIASGGSAGAARTLNDELAAVVAAGGAKSPTLNDMSMMFSNDSGTMGGAEAAGGRGSGARVINDELAVVVADKGNGGARVYALPEWADGGTMRDSGAAGPGGVPLSAVYVLSHAEAGEATTFERLTGAEAAGAVFSNMRFALPAPEAIRAAMDAADALRRAVPVSRMRFSLADAPRFWEVVDEFESGR